MSQVTNTPTSTSTTSGGPGADGGPAGGHKMSTASATLLVAEREITTQIRTKSFVISLAVMLVLAVGGVVASAFFADRLTSETSVVVVGEAEEAIAGVPGFEVTTAPDVDTAEQQVRDEVVDAALVADDQSPVGVSLIVLTDPPQELMAALSISPEVQSLEDGGQDFLRYIVAVGFGALFIMFTMGSGTMIMQNTITEKSSRIVEILLASVPSRALLAGKVLGNTVLALGQVVALAAAVILSLMLTGQGDLLDALSAPILWFVVFFLFGFVLVAAMFAAGASLVSRMEDSGPIMTPTMMIIMMPYFLVLFFNDNTTVMTIGSYVPFSAPVAMPVRMFVGEAAWWEPLLALGGLALAAALMIGIASKIYSNSLLKMGSRVSLKEALTSS